MSGAETLNFVRMKKVGDGAFERTSRQRRVLYELIGKLKDLSFIELSELTYAMLPLLGTDMTKSDDAPWREVVEWCRTGGDTEWLIVEYEEKTAVRECGRAMYEKLAAL